MFLHKKNVNKLFLLLLVIPILEANAVTDPAWWTRDTPDSRIIAAGATESNYAPLNVGQLKYVASKAKVHLDDKLTGGAGTAIANLVSGFAIYDSNDPEANYRGATLGQVKYVSRFFYDRLIEVGYDTRQNLIDYGATGWQHDYPWDPATPVDDNYKVAQLGQIKFIFSFDLDGWSMTDTDTDGIPDWWENRYFALLGDVSDFWADHDGDGINNLMEYYAQTDPTAFDYSTSATGWPANEALHGGVSGDLFIMLPDEGGYMVSDSTLDVTKANNTLK